MAAFASPRESPTIPPRGRPRFQGSASPPPQSKKDKRMNMLSNKLSDMVASFSAQHQEHYYAQLTAIQCDMNLIMRADPHTSGPLDDSPDIIRDMVQEARQELRRDKPLSEEAEKSFAAIGGKMYSEFVNEANSAMEERDKDLTMLMNEYEDGLAELRRTHQYKMQLAQEEHALLSKTLRERLVQSVTQRRTRLLRDKEQLDIADSSALLLNPNQFSLGNPASPGGVHTNRKTRHTRRVDPEEVGNATVDNGNGNGKKRNRKAAFEDTENDSTGPTTKPENGALRPQQEQKARMNYSQFEAPLYSVDRLFTEKDLAMNITKAHKATFAHFSKVRAQNGHTTRPPTATTSVDGENTKMEDAEETEAMAAAASLASLEEAGDGDAFSPTPSLFFYLPTKATQAYHATRSQRTTGLDLLAGAAAGPTPLVASINAALGKANPAAPTPASLEETYANEDLDLMKLDADNTDGDVLRQRCLDKTSVLSLGVGVENAGKPGTSSVRKADGDADNGQVHPTSTPMVLHGSGGLAMGKSGSNQATNGTDAVPPAGGVSMSRTSSEQRAKR